MRTTRTLRDCIRVRREIRGMVTWRDPVKTEAGLGGWGHSPGTPDPRSWTRQDGRPLELEGSAALRLLDPRLQASRAGVHSVD